MIVVFKLKYMFHDWYKCLLSLLPLSYNSQKTPVSKLLWKCVQNPECWSCSRCYERSITFQRALHHVSTSVPSRFYERSIAFLRAFHHVFTSVLSRFYERSITFLRAFHLVYCKRCITFLRAFRHVTTSVLHVAVISECHGVHFFT